MAIKAIVQKIISKGKHGPFFVATSGQIDDGSVTCSLEPTVWTEQEYPEEGEIVFLDKLRQKRAGWRAKTGRFWKLSDEQTEQTERSNQMQFLYPTSRQFPVDEVCEQIVRELEQRNWDIPGITVEFDVYGSGDQKMTLVRKIKGDAFHIRFGRPQGLLPGGHYNDTAAVNNINIPQKELRVYSDESGPTFYLYVGNDWERDSETFMNGPKVNSKLNNEPRTYLQYTGKCRCGVAYSVGHTHLGRRPPLLEHTDDLGREYSPKAKEPKEFRTAEIMEEFRLYLEKVVLKRIMSHPIPTKKIDVFTSPESIPFPESVGPIFCFSEYREAERIKQGKMNLDELNPADRYGLSDGGRRLMSLDTPNDSTVPEIAYEGFLWCGVSEVTDVTDIESLEVPGHYRWSDRERFVIRVNPNRANDIYIADHAEYEKRRKEICDIAEKEKRDSFTDAEVADFTRARARTIVPISEYQGGYEQPVVLIKRELAFDEVEVVSGPHERRRYAS